MKEKQKKIISIVTIIFLLPYVLTVFIKGEGAIPSYSSMISEEVYVSVSDEVIHVSWDEYLIGIVAKEIPEEYSLEAIKAQTIIVRTRLEEERQGSVDYIFEDSYYTIEQIQTKWGSNHSIEVYNQLVEAVEDTSDMVLMYNQQLVKAPYHMLNTGMTRNGNEVFQSEEYSYLLSVSCPLDIEADQEITMFSITYEEIVALLELEVENTLVFEDIQITSIDEAGYVLSVAIQDNVISGEIFRTALALKSSAFSFQSEEDGIRITTQGTGHGLGLSQNTAHYMGLEGKSYEEILSYFYPGTELVEY